MHAANMKVSTLMIVVLSFIQLYSFTLSQITNGGITQDPNDKYRVRCLADSKSGDIISDDCYDSLDDFSQDDGIIKFNAKGEDNDEDSCRLELVGYPNQITNSDEIKVPKTSVISAINFGLDGCKNSSAIVEATGFILNIYKN
ncbi:hypothetical protein BY996DRAFT_6410195 [Phakopsora pachyrhizi]|uniref:Expressed protein n=1 Tax=Phakopsora pachyrhizi TaxID=170000 RepID=A0A0S1MJ74_PHAPC|nr:hypothetical protein BY996DRAFT_6410195 [Phakopsora pachyrhizi]CAH7689549.1 expressed protein [Phakopsora pachyrhizi]